MAGLCIFPGPSLAAHENSISFSILPGAFAVALIDEGEFVVLNVDDATGTSQGWWVTLDCTCDLILTGELITLSGQLHEANGGPHSQVGHVSPNQSLDWDSANSNSMLRQETGL